MKRLLRTIRRSTGFKGGLFSQSGQGIVEYILVLAIVVILILSLLYRFNTAFRAYTEAFFDGYIACLLEVGELPGTGSTCQSEFPSFDLKNGKQLVKDGDGRGGQGGGKKNETPSKKTESHGSTGGKNGEVMSGGNRGSPVGSLGGSGRDRVAHVGNVGSGKEESGSGDSSMTINSSAVGNLGNNYRPRKTTMEVNHSGGIEESEADRAKEKSKSTGKTVEGDGKLRASKAVENTERRTTASKEEEAYNFTLGGFIRLLIIVIIIMAMIVFFGGQLMQIARSREKGGGE